MICAGGEVCDLSGGVTLGLDAYLELVAEFIMVFLADRPMYRKMDFVTLSSIIIHFYKNIS